MAMHQASNFKQRLQPLEGPDYLMTHTKAKHLLPARRSKVEGSMTVATKAMSVPKMQPRTGKHRDLRTTLPYQRSLVSTSSCFL